MDAGAGTDGQPVRHPYRDGRIEIECLQAGIVSVVFADPILVILGNEAKGCGQTESQSDLVRNPQHAEQTRDHNRFICHCVTANDSAATAIGSRPAIIIKVQDEKLAGEYRLAFIEQRHRCWIVVDGGSVLADRGNSCGRSSDSAGALLPDLKTARKSTAALQQQGRSQRREVGDSKTRKMQAHLPPQVDARYSQSSACEQ